MLRVIGIALLVLCALPVKAQLQHFADPTLWVSASSGVIWDRHYPSHVFLHDFSVSVASPRWILRGGIQISEPLHLGLDFSGMNLGGLAQASESEPPAQNLRVSDRKTEYGPYDPITFRSVYAAGGPFATSQWFMAGAVAGPTLTWGIREREVRTACLAESYCSWRYSTERSEYLNPGLAGGLQGFVRFGGRVWLGGETMLIANVSSTHIATRLALRVDLLRPDR